MSKITPRLQRAQLLRLAFALFAFGVLATACSTSEPQAAESTTMTTEAQPRQAAEPTTTSTTSSTTTTTTEPPPPPEVVVHVLGSIRSVPSPAGSTAENPVDDGTTTEAQGEDESEQADDGAEPSAPVLDTDDATIATLGCTQSTGCEPTDLAALAANQFEAINLASVAAAVDGPTVLDEFAGALIASGVSTIGYGSNLQEAIQPIIVGIDRPVALFGLSLADDLVSESIATETTPGILAGDEALPPLIEQIMATREAGNRAVVFIDWGRVEDRAPTEDELADIQFLVDLGVEVVVGHGSDFLQRFERIQASSVAFNLGNAFVSTAEELRTDTALLQLRFGDASATACLIPAVGGETGVSMDDPVTTDCS